MGTRTLTRTRVLVVPLDQPVDPFTTRADRIGREGIFVHSTSRLPADTSCLLKIIGDVEDPLWVRATVVHQIPGVGFGLKFAKLTPDTQTQLELARWLEDEDDEARALLASPLARARTHRRQRRTDQL
jgi:hypothetical protein